MKSRVLLGILILISLALISIVMTMRTWGNSSEIPIGQWTVYFVDEDGYALQNVDVELYRSNVMAYQRATGDFTEEIPFDNFLTENKITCKSGVMILTNSRELITFVTGYRILWYSTHKGYSFDVVLKAEAKNYEPVLINYEDICYAEANPIVIILPALNQHNENKVNVSYGEDIK